MLKAIIVFTFLLCSCSFAAANPQSATPGDAAASDAARAAQTDRVRRFFAGEESAFVESVREGDAQEAWLMLAFGADPNTESEGGAPVLVLATKAGSTELVRLLLDLGAKVDADDSNRYTALHYAAQSGDDGMVELLLARGADVNKKGYDEHTVLMFAMHGAIWSRLPEAIREVLLKQEEDEDDGDLTKRIATPEEYRRIVTRLIAAGAEVNVVAGCGEAALTFAACDIELVKMMLAAGARVDYGWSPLCLVDDVTQEKFAAAMFDGIEDEKKLEELRQAAREWVARTAVERREIASLLVAAGATRHNCDDEDDDDK